MSVKKVKVVMLPTNEKANLKLGQNGLLVNNTFGYDSHFTNQHLYFLSDEEIKEGDWFYADEYSKPEQAKHFDGKLVNGFVVEFCKKIIATTDEFLSEQIMYYPDGSIIGGMESYKILPQPSTSFIEKFVEEYNKGCQISEVLVEYEEY